MITIILPISRHEYLDTVFAGLEFLDISMQEVNLLTIVDGDVSLYEKARNYVELSKFNERLCVQYKTKDKKKNYDMNHRRLRIANIHNYAKQYIQKSDYIFCIEDDTTFQPDTLKRLIKNYTILPFAGFIQGLQVGRWGINHYGVWKADSIYDISSITSMLRGDGLVECDAGGLYCMMTKAEIYMAHNFQPFNGGDLGPDVDYGIELRKQGYKNYTDWQIPCNHHVKDGIIEPYATDIQQVKFIKVDNRFRQKTL